MPAKSCQVIVRDLPTWQMARSSLLVQLEEYTVSRLVICSPETSSQGFHEHKLLSIVDRTPTSREGPHHRQRFRLGDKSSECGNGGMIQRTVMTM